MQIKTAILIIRYATTASLVLFIASVCAYFFTIKDIAYIILWGILMFSAIMVMVLKNRLLSYLIATVKYPGILYGVCESMGYLNGMGVNITNDTLNDLYRPAYDTSTFLKDNKLTAELYSGPSATQPRLNESGLLPASASAGRFYKFLPHGLQTENGLYTWQNVANWKSVLPTSKEESPLLEIRLHRIENGGDMIVIETRPVFTTLLHLEMLLHHYKYKYGYNEHSPL